MSQLGTVLIISSVHWHFTWQRHHDVATGLAKEGFRVIYLEPMPKRWPGLREWRRVFERLTGRGKSGGVVAQPVPAEIEFVSPLMFPDTAPPVRRINRTFFLPGLEARLAALQIQRPLILINYLPIPASVTLQRKLRPDAAIYECVDDWSHDPYYSAGQLAEKELLGLSDLVFTTSDFLFEKMNRMHHAVVQLLPAVQYERFAAAASTHVPDQLRPRLAYFGDMARNIDMNLLRAVSHQYPLRLIGPLRDSPSGFAGRTEFIGPVSHDRVPALLQDVDVLLLPYSRQAAHVPAVIPAKTFECLATGKPTVAIGLSSLERFREYIYLCQSESEFIEAIRAAAAEDPSLRRDRQELARQNSWPVRIAEMTAHIRKLL